MDDEAREEIEVRTALAAAAVCVPQLQQQQLLQNTTTTCCPQVVNCKLQN